jgi:hypothetical protein
MILLAVPIMESAGLSGEGAMAMAMAMAVGLAVGGKECGTLHPVEIRDTVGDLSPAPEERGGLDR